MLIVLLLSFTSSLTITLNGKDCTGSTFNDVLNSCGETASTVKSLIVKEGNFELASITNDFKLLSELNIPKTSFASAIPDNKFRDMKSLTNVNIGGATDIGISAFRNCDGLQLVSFDSCTKIKQYAFSECSSLKQINFPNLLELHNNAFEKTALTEVQLDSVSTITLSVSNLGQHFRNCGKLTHISMKNANIISSGMFENCNQLISVDFPKATGIGERAFVGCQSFSDLTFPMVKTIYGSAFEKCNSIIEINLPSVLSIGYRAFQNCFNLKKVSFAACTKIEQYGFCYCESLVSINFPNLQKLYYFAFEYTSLIKVELDSVSDIVQSSSTSIDSQFRNCGKLTHISMKNANKISRGMFENCNQLNYLDFSACSDVASNGLTKCNNIQTLIIGYSTVNFLNIPSPSQLKQISFPKALSISSSALSDLKNLVFCNLESVTTIESGTFANLNKLVELEIPKVTELKANAFTGCTCLSSISLKSLSIVDSTSANIFNGCPYLKTLYFPENPPHTFHPDTFKGMNCQIIIQTTSISVYDDDVSITGDKASDGFWCGLPLPSKDLTIKINKENKAYSGQQLSDCIKLAGISESLITSLEIDGCSITLSSLISSINSLPNLVEFIISESTIIEDDLIQEMFKDTIFTSITIGASINKIPSNCFKGCTNLKTATFTNCKEVEGQAFSGCSSLQKVTINAEKLTGDSHFEGCTSLSSVSMTHLTTVDPSSANIFADCPLTSLYFPQTPPSTFHPKTFEGKHILFFQLTNNELKNYDSNTEVEGDVSGDYKWCGIDLIQIYIQVAINDNDYVFSDSIANAMTINSVSSVTKLSIKGGLIKDSTWNEIKGITTLTSLDILETAFLESYIINSEQFKDLTSLVHISIMHDISLSENCFMGCTSLNDAKFGSVSLLSEGSFKDCSNLQTLIIPKCRTLKGDSIFANCAKLQEIDLSSLEYVDESSVNNFAGCIMLKKLTLPSDEPSTFNKDSFKDCTNLQLALPFAEDFTRYDDKSKVEGDEPEDSMWCSVKFDDSLVQKGLYFKINGVDYRRRSIRNVPILKSSSTLKTLEDAVELKTLELIEGLFDGYDIKIFISGSKTLEKFVAHQSTLESLTTGTFTGCSSLKEITILSNAKFDLRLFQNLPSLTTLSVQMLKTIVSDEFEGDTNLQVVSLPSLSSVPMNAFASFANLKEITLSSATSLFDGCFENCASLEEIELPSVTNIFGDSHFNGCINLKSINLTSLETVFSNASLIFGSCSKLDTLMLPNEPPKNFNENIFVNARIVPTIKLLDENRWESYYKQCKVDETTSHYIWYGYDTNIVYTKDVNTEKGGNKCVSKGALAGAIVGSIIGSAAITAGVIFLVLYLKGKERVSNISP